MKPLIVTPEQDGMRLDRLVMAAMGLSRRCARLVIGAGRVRVGGRTCKILTRTLSAGAKLVIEPEAAALGGEDALPAAPAGHKPRALPDAGTRVLHLDRWLVAVDKPAGLLSEADRFGGPCVMEWLGAWLRRQKMPDALWLVHRLDAGTSGVLLLARHRGTAASLNAAFAQRLAKKTYLALTAGVPAQPRMSCDGAIARVRGTQHAVTSDGKPARTEVTVLQQHGGMAQVQAEPHTGRTHQIRVHLSHAGCPIVGDRLYGGPGYIAAAGQDSAATPPARGPSVPVARPLLHARSLVIGHPKTGAELAVIAPIPADYSAAAKLLQLTVASAALHPPAYVP